MRPPAARAASARRGNDDEEPDLSLRQSAPEGASELIHDGLHHLRQRFRRERSHCTHSGPAGGKAARGKCLAVAKDHPGAVVLGCDTVVDVGGEVFGKPHSVEDAKRMLRALSGAAHEVHTGVCVSDGIHTESFVDSCRVTFFPISEGEIDAYTATKEPYDKAGAYAIQGRAALWLDRLEGDYYTIMGLPVSRTARLLSRF